MVKLIGVIGIVLMVVEYAQPIQWIKNFLKIGNQSEPKQLYLQVIQKMVNCALCIGFWIGLGFYLDLYMAVIIAFISELIYRILSKVL